MAGQDADEKLHHGDEEHVQEHHHHHIKKEGDESGADARGLALQAQIPVGGDVETHGTAGSFPGASTVGPPGRRDG